MGKLTDQALKLLSSKKERDVSRGLMILGEIAAANVMTGFRSDIVPEATKELLTKRQLKELQKRIVRYVDKNPENHPTISAIFCLGKFFDATLLPQFNRWLKKYSIEAHHRAQTVGQILVALNNLGQPAIIGDSFSFDEYSKNLSDAETYLKNQKGKKSKRP